MMMMFEERVQIKDGNLFIRSFLLDQPGPFTPSDIEPCLNSTTKVLQIEHTTILLHDDEMEIIDQFLG